MLNKDNMQISVSQLHLSKMHGETDDTGNNDDDNDINNDSGNDDDFFCVPQLYLWGSPLLGEILRM